MKTSDNFKHVRHPNDQFWTFLGEDTLQNRSTISNFSANSEKKNIRHIFLTTNEADQKFKKPNRYQICKLQTILHTLELLTIKFGLLLVNLEDKINQQFSDFQ